MLANHKIFIQIFASLTCQAFAFVSKGKPVESPLKSHKTQLIPFGRVWEAKINEALLLIVTCRRDARWRNYSRAAASVMCVFQATTLEEMWKTQSPPVSMETPSLSQAKTQSTSTLRIGRVNYFTLFNPQITNPRTIDR